MDDRTEAPAEADQALVRRCVAGDASAWEDLVLRHVDVLHSAAARLLGSGADAEDAVQAVFLKLWQDGRRRLAQFQGRSRLSTWLVAVVQREALDRLRSRPLAARTVSLDPARDALAGSPAARNGHSAAVAGAARPEADLEERDAFAALLDRVDRLPPRDRLLVRLVYVDERPYREVALFLAVPENSISPWLSRARQRLRSLLLEATRTDPDAASL